MNKFRNLKPSIDAIIANDYIDFLLDTSSRLLFKNKIVPKKFASSEVFDDKATNSTFNDSAKGGNQPNRSNSSGFDHADPENIELLEEENDGVYEPINEEDVLFPDYLAPDETVGIRRAGAFASGGTPNSKFGRGRNAELDYKISTSRRKKVNRFIHGTLYSTFIFVSLVFVSFVYALENPTMPPDHYFKRITFWVDVVIWIIFFVDLCLKIYIHPLHKSRKYLYIISYLIDITVLIISLFYLIGNSRLAWARILRTFKVLMVIKKINILKSIAKSLFASVKEILSIFMFLMSLYFVFDIMFVRYYAGTYYYCDTTNIVNKE